MQRSASHKQNLKYLTASLLILVATFFFLPLSILAQGNLLLLPKRVVFDGTKRSEELNLANTGKDSATYVLSFIQIRMKKNGEFERITEPDSGQNFANRYLRFFPRSVTLAPGETQVVRVQITKSNELKPGEYRSHIYFRAVPKERPLGDMEPANDTSISIRLVPIFGITIPVIIRVGESTAQVSISDLQIIKDAAPSLQLTFSRNGNMSVYGDITVEHISPKGKITQVGNVQGLAVYTPTSQRSFRLLLKNTPDIDYNSGKLHVTYKTAENKPVSMAEAGLDL